VTSPLFVGRTAELAALRAAAADAASGLVVVLVGGEPGMGKSRLVAEFAAGLEGDPLVLAGECLELGAPGLPYGPFLPILRRLGSAFGVEAVARWLPDGGRRGLAHLLPGLGEPLPNLDPAYGRARLFDDVRTLLDRAAAGRRLVLVLEDLHWADASSRELLLYLVHALAEAPVLIVGTYRPAEPEPLAALARSPTVRKLSPAALDRPAVARLLGGRGTQDVAAILARSGGNPLFVEALAEAGHDAVPAPLRDLLLGGYRALPETSRAVLRAISIGGDRADHDLVAAVTGLAEAALETALRPAFERRVLVAAGDGYAFRHALFRAAVAEELLPSERRRLHRRYAEALVASGRAGSASDLAGPVDGELAVHWDAAGEPGLALDAAWRAAGAAGLTYAHAERARLLDRVLGLWALVPEPAERIGTDRAELLRLAASACLHAGDTARGLAQATEALAATSDPERVGRLLELRSLLAHRQGEDGVDDLRAALRLLPAAAVGTRARLLATLASRLNVLGSADGVTAAYLESAEAAAEALRLARLAGDRAVEALAMVTLADHATSAGDFAAARSLTEEASRLAEEVGDYDTMLLVAVMEAVGLKHVGDHRAAVVVAANGLAVARRAGLSQTRGAVLAAVRADSLACLGEWSAAATMIGEYLALDPPPLYRAVLLTGLGSVTLAAGDLDAATEAATAAAEVLADGYSGREFGLPLIDLRARLALAAGRGPEARALLAPVLTDHATSTGDLASRPDLAWPLLATAASAMVAATDHRPDADAGQRLRSVAAALPATTPVNAALRATVEAELAGTRAAWTAAVAAWRPLGQPYPLATALFRAAEATVVAGDRPAATLLAREADALAANLGAAPLRREIALLATRGRLGLADPSGQLPAAASSNARRSAGELGLTAREIDVLKLVADGRTNRQIAEELFISAKTAGVHVSNILGKLGVRTRTEAAATAHRRRLFDG
jgi:DNA-binding CsgD family transcriptional regulator